VVAQLGKVGASASLAIYALIPALYFATILFTPPQLRPLLHTKSDGGGGSRDETAAN
jgi:hypothetical protein